MVKFTIERILCGDSLSLCQINRNLYEIINLVHLYYLDYFNYELSAIISVVYRFSL